MATELIRRALSSAVLMGLLFIVLIASLYVLGTTGLRLERFGQYYPWLILGNGLALAFIGVLIGLNGWRLVREFRAQVAGSRLTVKLVVASILLALVPVTLVYGFSVRFMRANINSYFDVEIEQALDASIELSRESLGLQMRTLQRETTGIAERLVGVDDSVAVVALNALSADSEASEMTLIGPDNRVIASTGLLDNMAVQPNRPDDDLAARARQGISYVGVDPIRSGELYIRVVTPVFSEDPTREPSVLLALYPVSKASASLAETVQSSYQRYRQLVFLRKPLITSSILTLSLALLLSVMMAVWFALYAARRMMMPVHDLVEGTRAVADGNLAARIYKRGKNDELGFLVQSFNYMTLQLEQARDTAEASQRQIESQRAYLQAVLGQISSGVVTLNAQHLVRTSNQAATGILGEALQGLHDRPLREGLADGGVLGQFCDQLIGSLERYDPEWSAEIEVMDGASRRFLFVRAAQMYDADGDVTGTVLVIDDVTTLISAQRDAAWSEVARRLAHEIKNPLTPIQLSAERLRHKFAAVLPPESVEVLTRLTRTIENQVDAMKSMVNAFASYAAAPRLNLVPTDLNQLLAEMAELYRDRDGRVRIHLSLDSRVPGIPVDVPRIRQLMHNLLKNALEAAPAAAEAHVEPSDEPSDGSSVREIRLSTRVIRQRGVSRIEIITQDNGPGFPESMLGRLFEPYVTSKPRGTGLGLAIVKKIVEEHSGTISAENRPTGGAVVTVSLPFDATAELRGDAA